jgi:hypothetical protein
VGATEIEIAHRKLLSDWRASWEALKPALEELHLVSSESDSPVLKTAVEKKAETLQGGRLMVTMCVDLGFQMLAMLMEQGTPTHPPTRPPTASFSPLVLSAGNSSTGSV